MKAEPKFRLVIGGTAALGGGYFVRCRAKSISGAIAALRRAMKTTYCNKGQVQYRGPEDNGWYVLWTQMPRASRTVALETLRPKAES